jgi:hypothetical protein
MVERRKTAERPRRKERESVARRRRTDDRGMPIQGAARASPATKGRTQKQR